MKKLQSFKNLCKSPTTWLNDLKSVIANFDIKPSRPVAQELLVQATIAYDAGKINDAIAILTKMLRIYPKNYDAILMLSDLYQRRGHLQLGCKLLKRAVKLYPDDYYLYQILGTYYKILGEMKAGAAAYRAALKIKPDYAAAIHMLAAITKTTPDIAPRQYIVSLFNGYADYYDTSLLDTLDYRAHIELVQFLHTIHLPDPLEDVLDLGCGTGLLGQQLKVEFKATKLVGVDLAENMLDQCRTRNLYTELHQADIIEFLQQSSSNYDLITATDVLVYVGDLDPILQHSHKNLKPQGFLGFTVEVLPQGTFNLGISGRYQHSLSYITTLCNRYGFNKIYSKTIDLRKEYGNIVPGYLVLLQK